MEVTRCRWNKLRANRLLQKIEELTLYLIRQQKEIDQMKAK